jgi:hypothetical protein
MPLRNGSCVGLCVVALLTVTMIAPCSSGNKTLGSRLMPKSASRPTIVGLTRLLRSCARPPFALERLEAIDEAHQIYLLKP